MYIQTFDPPSSFKFKILHGNIRFIFYASIHLPIVDKLISPLSFFPTPSLSPFSPPRSVTHASCSASVGLYDLVKSKKYPIIFKICSSCLSRFPLGVSVCTKWRFKHQRCSKTCRVQKNHNILGKTHNII